MKKQFNTHDINIIIRMYVKEFNSLTEIGKKYGCGDKPIKRILSKNGIAVVGGSPMSPNYWILRGMTIKEAKHKIKTIRPTNIEYWENIGFSKKEAKIKLTTQRLLTKSAFLSKYGNDIGLIEWEKRKIINTENAKKRFSSCSEYWINRGVTNKCEIINNISAAQRKFSLDICVEKYGELEGKKIWEKRQINWQKKINNNPKITEINKLKDCKSVKYYMRKYDEVWLEKLIENRGYSKESINYLKACVDNSKTYNDLLEYITINYEYIDYYNFQYRLCRKLFCEIYDVSLEKFKFDLQKKYLITSNGIFGNKRELNGVVYSSNGEYYIAKSLLDSGVEFIYNKKYPFINTKIKYRYDFYLPKYNQYLEYAGMLFYGLRNNKIIIEYEKKMKTKIDLCAKHNFNVFVSVDYLSVVNYVKTL